MTILPPASNQFHGSACEYGRNDRFDANDFFSNSAGVPKAKLRYNDYGWSLGGPIFKDKLFFFAGEEWKKIRAGRSSTRSCRPSRPSGSALAGTSRSAIRGRCDRTS